MKRKQMQSVITPPPRSGQTVAVLAPAEPPEEKKGCLCNVEERLKLIMAFRRLVAKRPRQLTHEERLSALQLKREAAIRRAQEAME